MIDHACLWRKRSKTVSLSCFVRYPCTWRRASPRRRVCDIVLRRKVFNRRRALMFLSQLQVVTGQVATSLSKFAMHGRIADSASAKAAVTVFSLPVCLATCTGGVNGRGLLSGCRRLCQQEEQILTGNSEKRKGFTYENKRKEGSWTCRDLFKGAEGGCRQNSLATCNSVQRISRNW